MVARLIQESDVIEVARPPVLLFGEPGSGKTSLGQTADKSLTLDFDQGLHRSAFRKAGLRFTSWDEVVVFQGEKGFDPFETIVLDTVGTMLDYMGQSVIAQNAKMGTRAGGLSLQGWGVLKTTFGQWLSALRQAGKQVIMIAHQKEEKDGDDRVLRPDIAGGSYSIVMNSADIVGYMSYRNNARFIAWEPTDRYFAKNGAQLKSGPIPDFKVNPRFMGELLDQAKANLGRTSQASAAVAKAVEDWRAKLTGKPIADFNAVLPELKDLGLARPQGWKIACEIATAQGWTFDDAAKAFVAQAASPPVPIQPPPAGKPKKAKKENINQDADDPPEAGAPPSAVDLHNLLSRIEVLSVEKQCSVHGLWPDGTPIMPTGKSRPSQLTVEEARVIVKGMEAL